MNKSYIISGTLFGDEGKGTFVDFLANEKNIHECIRYNGGSQACHTVMVHDEKHKFSQLGSNMFDKYNRTYLSSNTIVNPFSLYRESSVFSKEKNISINEIMNKVYIDKDSLVVTPYHSLLDRIIELSKKENKRGIVGTGVSLTRKLYDEISLGIKMDDLVRMDSITTKKLLELHKYVRSIIREKRKNIDDNTFDRLINEEEVFYLTDPSNEEYIIDCYRNIMNSDLFNISSNIKEFHNNNEGIVMEGSQGLLIDREYGIKPNSTFIDTTNKYGIYLSEYLDIDYVKVGATRAFASRHGIGVLPTKDELLNRKLFDGNQTHTFWQGKPIYGWYDTVLMRYSQSISNNDELFISSLDLLSFLDKIKICDKYLYTGVIDEEFKQIFEYETIGNKVYINNIKQNSDKLRYYLEKSIPIYIELNGWKTDISNIKEYEDLPIECINYLDTISELVGVKITVVGVGPRRENKLRRKL